MKLVKYEIIIDDGYECFYFSSDNFSSIAEIWNKCKHKIKAYLIINF